MSNFFEYLLFKGGNSASRAELETETLPYKFTSNSHKLRNYRIYGADGGVGDYDSESDKYIISLRISGKNLFNANRSLGSRVGCTVSVDNAAQTITINATSNSDSYFGSSLSSAGAYTSNCGELLAVDENKKYSLSVSNGNVTKNLITCFDENKISLGYKWQPTNNITLIAGTKYVSFRIGVSSPVYGSSYPFTVQFEENNAATVYEPYCEPKTVNIYLDEPLNEEEYIDFLEQKRFNGDDTSETVALPVIPIISGTNIISVDTEVQPSRIYLQGNIAEVQAVSLSMLSPKMANISTEFDGDELPHDVMPMEISDLELNNIGGDENAE